nr:lipoate--protein ligase [uncultured Oscillibacter sp.]
MKRVTHYLETGSTDPYYNLAFEEYVLAHRREGDYLLLWQNDNTIVIGQNQNAEAEINRAFVSAHGIHVVRRSTGGGAVYHDLGNLNYSFITDAENAEQIAIQRFTEPVVQALKGLGLAAEASGRNDILVNGRKVSGTAQRWREGRILHHGTLLFDSDPDMVAGALNVDPEKFRSKGTKSVRSRIGNIRPCLERDMTLPEFWAYLKTALTGSGLIPARLLPEELEGVEALKREKYDDWEWNFGRSPKYNMTNKRYWEGGMLEVAAGVEKGRITDITFWGDFLAVDSMEPVTQALRGCLFEREQVQNTLSAFPIARYFGAVTEQEILETLFDF